MSESKSSEAAVKFGEELHNELKTKYRPSTLAALAQKRMIDENPEVQALVEKAHDDGVRKAASLAGDMYDGSSVHPFMIEDCVLAKLNMLDQKPRKNDRQVKAWPKELNHD